MKSLLVIEDNPEIQILVEGSLAGYRVVPALSLKDAQELMRTEKFDLIILDLELPDGDGLRFLTEIARQSPQYEDVPVFILTAKSDVSNKIIAFSLGVDDFVVKPFDPLELRARIQAKLSKLEKTQSKSDTLRFKDLWIEVPQQRVFIQSGSQKTSVNLTSIEFKLLVLFVKNPDRVYSRAQLLDIVWGEVAITDRTVDTHVGHLRKKIAPSAARLETVFNEGYRLLP